ncbi:MAG: DUF1622 domain-containing protein [Pseudomonadota bacterium]
MEMPANIFDFLEYVTLFVDGVGYAILIFTVVKFVIRYLAFEFHRVRGLKCAQMFREIRMEFLSHVILAIDFMVVSDVIRSGLIQDRESLITLGVFVLIRSVLAFFLGLDLKDLREETKEETTS